MCRGQYYMVWRSLMEHVEPKDTIRQKRLRVFCDDIYKYKRKNAFNKVCSPFQKKVRPFSESSNCYYYYIKIIDETILFLSHEFVL